jgi:hypothetical protein
MKTLIPAWLRACLDAGTVAGAYSRRLDQINRARKKHGLDVLTELPAHLCTDQPDDDDPVVTITVKEIADA